MSISRRCFYCLTSADPDTMLLPEGAQGRRQLTGRLLTATAIFSVLLAACSKPAEVGITDSASVNESPLDLPNILLVLVDDMGFSDIGPYGSEVATPNLDTLAQSGMAFNQFRNTS